MVFVCATCLSRLEREAENFNVQASRIVLRSTCRTLTDKEGLKMCSHLHKTQVATTELFFSCASRGCGKRFERLQSCKRHVRQVHDSNCSGERFVCTHAGCSRKRPFRDAFCLKRHHELVHKNNTHGKSRVIRTPKVKCSQKVIVSLRFS